MKLGPYLLGYNDTNQGIYTGDAKVLCEEIPDESIDLIFTDPVYQKIEDYSWLAEMAQRVLKDGGSVIAQVGSEFRYDAETAMRKSTLTPMPLLAEVYPMAYAPMYRYHVFQGWKPHIWMCKCDGNRKGAWVFDRVRGKGRKKRHHAWEDDNTFISDYINRLSNGIVLDPFTGSGTVPAACKMLSRPYLAFEINPQTATIARNRLTETPIPLPLPTTTQLDLL